MMIEIKKIEVNYTEFTITDTFEQEGIYYSILKGYKKALDFEDIGVYSNNYSDAKFLKSFYPEVTNIVIHVKDNLNQEYGYSEYKAYPTWILEDYFGGIVKDLKQIDDFSDKKEADIDYINEKHQRSRKIATDSYRLQMTKSTQNGLRHPNYTLLEFYYWLINHPDYDALYKNWMLLGFCTDNKPSFIMLDWKKPYAFENLKLVTYKENKEYVRSYRKVHSIRGRRVGQYNTNGELVNEFKSIVEASRQTDARAKGISKVLAGSRNTHKGFIWKYL